MHPIANKEIIAAVVPTLKQFGQVFVGLDVIGGYLTELNITSPTGVRHIARLEQRNVAGPILDKFVVAQRAPLTRRRLLPSSMIGSRSARLDGTASQARSSAIARKTS